MTDHELAGITQKPGDYRGALVYKLEYGYKLVAITLSVASNEQGQVRAILTIPLTQTFPLNGDHHVKSEAGEDYEAI